MPDNAAPFEIIAAPFEAYIAAVGTTFPDVDTAPVGTSGDLNYTEEGVTVEQPQDLSFFTPLGSTMPVKATRTTEGLKIRFTLADLSLEQYKLALNGNAVTAAAAAVGTPGTKTIGLTRGQSVTQYALLLRGPSPYMAAGAAQYEVPVCVQSGNPQPVFRKGADQPADLALEFTALRDPNASSSDEEAGRLVCQTAEANT